MLGTEADFTKGTHQWKHRLVYADTGKQTRVMTDSKATERQQQGNSRALGADLRAVSVLRSCSVAALTWLVRASVLSSSSRSSCWSAAAFLAAEAASTSSLVFTLASATAAATAVSTACIVTDGATVGSETVERQAQLHNQSRYYSVVKQCQCCAQLQWGTLAICIDRLGLDQGFTYACSAQVNCPMYSVHWCRVEACTCYSLVQALGTLQV